MPSSLHAGLVLAVALATAPEHKAPEHTVTGRLEIHAGLSTPDFGARKLFVLLPAHYDAAKRYPVVYAQDGQNLFDVATAANRDEWGLDELLDAHPSGVPDLIVVGIEAGPSVLRDLSPPGSLDDARGDLYLRFLTDTVKPWIDSHYSTRHDPGATVVLGEGAGALFAVYAGWTRADVFGGAIAIELPDLDRDSVVWTATPPRVAGGRMWIEQSGGDQSMRPSTTSLLSTLRQSTDVRFAVGSGYAARLSLVTTGLRFVLDGR